MEKKTIIVFFSVVAFFIIITAFLSYKLLDSYVSLSYAKQELAENQEQLKLTILMIDEEFSGIDKKDFMKKIDSYSFINKESVFVKNNGREVYIDRVGFEFKNNKFFHVIFTPRNN